MRSSIEASRCGMSFAIALESTGKPNWMVAEIREPVVNGATVSGAKGGLSAAKAVEQRASRPNAASPARADPCKVIRERRDVECEFIIRYLSLCLHVVFVTTVQWTPGLGGVLRAPARRQSARGIHHPSCAAPT